MTDHVWKLKAVFSDHNINFKSTDSEFNVITKKVLDPNLAKVFLDCEAIGEALYNNFFDERLFSEVSRSLFNRYDVLISSKDKSSVFDLIKDLSPAFVITDSGD